MTFFTKKFKFIIILNCFGPNIPKIGPYFTTKEINEKTYARKSSCYLRRNAKNFILAGVTLIIILEDLLGHLTITCPSILD